MAPFRHSIVLAVLLSGIGSSAAALTAEDVTKKMNSDQRVGYLTGLIDMLAYQTAASGNRDRGSCITDRFYRERKEDSWARLRDVLDKFSDKPPEVLLAILADQLCQK